MLKFDSHPVNTMLKKETKKEGRERREAGWKERRGGREGGRQGRFLHY